MRRKMALQTTSGPCLPAVEMFSNKTRKLLMKCVVLVGAGPGPARTCQLSSRCVRTPLVRCRSSPRWVRGQVKPQPVLCSLIGTHPMERPVVPTALPGAE